MESEGEVKARKEQTLTDPNWMNTQLQSGRTTGEGENGQWKTNVYMYEGRKMDMEIKGEVKGRKDQIR